MTTLQQRASGLYTPVPFRTHMQQMYKGPDRWEQGDHVFVCAPTKAGKTTLMSSLVKLRSHVVVLVTKQRDTTFAREFKGWTILREWPKGGPPPYEKRILLWPAWQRNKDATIVNQRRVFRNALEQINRDGRRCLVWDEALYLTDPKFGGLGDWLSYLSFHGRSSGITLVTLSQRPSWIPRVVRSSVTHAYIARTRDRDDLKALSDLGGVDSREVASVLNGLPTRHDYVYLNPQGDAEPAIINTRI